MTAVAVSPLEPDVARAVADAGDSIAALIRLATILVSSGMLPEKIKEPAQAVAIILAGREIGVPAMTALRSINLVQGKVEIAADLQLAQFKEAGGRAQWRQDDDAGAVLWLKHPNGDEYVSPFTEKDARKAGLWTKTGPWQGYPRAMMRARAVTAGLRALGWKSAVGVYDGPSGELRDGVPEFPETARVMREEVEHALGASPAPPVETPAPAAAPEVDVRLIPASERARASEAQIARLLDLAEHPRLAAKREAILDRLRKPIKATVAATWITAYETEIAGPLVDAAGAPAPHVGGVGGELPLEDARPARRTRDAIAEGH